MTHVHGQVRHQLDGLLRPIRVVDHLRTSFIGEDGEPCKGPRARTVALVSILGALGVTLENSHAADAADYAGSDICKTCHDRQAATWERSDHFHAMQDATAATVAGDFSGSRVTFHGMTTRFFREGNGYFVDTVGPSGDRRTYPVRYTFGHRPLQQYLLDTGNGILQAFDVAWDTRQTPIGQRWYHLQADEPMDPEHPFFWTGHAMNWSSHCADCHSTNVVKQFDTVTRQFRTTHTEINVACEACHGPGWEHVKLAEAGALSDSTHAGFGSSPAPRMEWRFAPGEAIAKPHGSASDREIDMCGGCHSLRTPLTASPSGKPYHEAYRLELLDDIRYFADGQIREEVFVLGSFLQSKMHVRGVTCGNCHEPHSGDLHFAGNGVCAQCHRADVYDVAAHHRHPPGEPGSACVDCHMPARTYMGVDERRDHSFPIPQPTLSAELGVPNACVSCHRGRDNRWAVESLRDWGVATDSPHWGRANARLRRGDPEVLASIESLLESPDLSPLVKASVLAQTPNMPNGAPVEVLKRWLDDPDPLIRRGAVAGSVGLPDELRFWMLANRLGDAHPGVRFELAVALTDIYPALPSAARRAAAPLLGEYRDALAASADLAASQNALARLAVQLGQTRSAESAFTRALEIDRMSLRALVDLADFRRAEGREQEAGVLLRRALAVAPGNGTANVAYGLHLVRLGRHEEALEPLSTATRTDDAEPRFTHIYAVALHSLGHRDQAIARLRRGIERWPWNLDLLTTLVTVVDDARSDEVQRLLERLQQIAPDAPRVRALVERYTRHRR